MKNITDLKVTQIRIFPVDIVPLSLIASKSCTEKLRDTFSIGEGALGRSVEGKEILVFRKGEVRRDKKLIVINRIEVDARRIILEVEGTSGDGNEVYESFLATVASIGEVDAAALRRPLLVAEAAQCTATLDFGIDALFSNVFTELLNKKVGRKASSNLAKASVMPLAIAAEITYEITDKALVDNKITMNPKPFSIVARPGAPSEARKYLVSSPFDSETHLTLIDELNKAVIAASKENEKAPNGTPPTEDPFELCRRQLMGLGFEVKKPWKNGIHPVTYGGPQIFGLRKTGRGYATIILTSVGMKKLGRLWGSRKPIHTKAECEDFCEKHLKPLIAKLK